MLPKTLAALVVALSIAGCGAAEAPAPAPPPAPTPAPGPAPVADTQPVALDDADAPKSKKSSKPQAPLLPDGSRSKFLAKSEGRKVVAAFLAIRAACRRVMVAYDRAVRADTFEGIFSIEDKEFRRIGGSVDKWDQRLAVFVKAYKQTPRGAVVTERGPHTLYELMDQIGDAFARDCQVERSASRVEKQKRRYGRKFMK